MSLRILELVFRKRLLIVACLLGGAVLGVAWMAFTYHSSYTSQASIWVEMPTDPGLASGTAYNVYNTPAQNQVAAMQEVLTVKAFLAKVLTDVDPNIQQNDLAFATVRKNTTISAVGTHVVSIEYRSLTATTSVAMVNALLQEYEAYYSGVLQDNAGKANALYKVQVDFAKGAYDSATLDLKAYISTHPQYASVDLDKPVLNAGVDADFARLLQNEASAKQGYEDVLNKYADSQIAASSLGSSTNAFALLDAAELPGAPTRPGMRSLAAKPMIGIVFGLVLTGGLLLLFWRVDSSVRVASDLAGLAPGVPLIDVGVLSAPRRSGWPESFVRRALAIQAGLLQARPIGLNVLPTTNEDHH